MSLSWCRQMHAVSRKWLPISFNEFVCRTFIKTALLLLWIISWTSCLNLLIELTSICSRNCEGKTVVLLTYRGWESSSSGHKDPLLLPPRTQICWWRLASRVVLEREGPQEKIKTCTCLRPTEPLHTQITTLRFFSTITFFIKHSDVF